MYDHVLLPTDGSEGSTAVAEHAGWLAQQSGATVHVLSVVDTRNRFESPSSGIASDAWEETERERAQQAVADAAAALPDDVTTNRVVDAGIPHEQILDYAESSEIDILVMGTHGRTGVEHYLIGSVAERVVRQSPVPVLTARIED